MFILFFVNSGPNSQHLLRIKTSRRSLPKLSIILCMVYLTGSSMCDGREGPNIEHCYEGMDI